MTETTKVLEIEQGSNSMDIGIWSGGDVEITLYRKSYEWGKEGSAIVGDIVLNNKQAHEMLVFLQEHLTKQ